MIKGRFNPRIILAILALLSSLGFLYFSRSDHVPHDPESRVKPEVFWAAIGRANSAQRPTNIVVYPARMGVQLVTCTGHPPNGPSLDKYLYVKLGPGDRTVEARLTQLGISFETPWWDSDRMRYGPWVGVAVAIILLIIPAVTELWRIAGQAPARGSHAPVPAPVAPTSADFQKVRELEEAMESALSNSTGGDFSFRRPGANGCHNRSARAFRRAAGGD